jgi:hypothetical protein
VTAGAQQSALRQLSTYFGFKTVVSSLVNNYVNYTYAHRRFKSVLSGFPPQATVKYKNISEVFFSSE